MSSNKMLSSLFSIWLYVKQDLLNLLLKYGANVNKQLSAGKDKLSPLMLAAAHGHLDIARRLVQEGATVELLGINLPYFFQMDVFTAIFYIDEMKMYSLVMNCLTIFLLSDKYKRSALTHAVMNGNANVASYLLYLGSDPNRVDSSGNSLTHYAAAYGWYFVLKLLVNEGGAKPSVANDWQV